MPARSMRPNGSVKFGSAVRAVDRTVQRNAGGLASPSRHERHVFCDLRVVGLRVISDQRRVER